MKKWILVLTACLALPAMASSKPAVFIVDIARTVSTSSNTRLTTNAAPVWYFLPCTTLFMIQLRLFLRNIVLETCSRRYG